MYMKKALLFGSIGAIMETSDIQRRAYNQAMMEAGLPWIWDRSVYADLLEQSGGKDRLAMLAAATGFTLSQARIDAIHARKMDIACTEIITTKVSPRPGVVKLAHMAKDMGMKLGFVTTTYQPNIDAIFGAMGDTLSPDDFDHIVDRQAVENGKPSPDAYFSALAALGVSPEDALAIEDTALSVMSAKRAGVQTIATPGEISASQDFWQADLVIPALADSDGVINPHMLALIIEIKLA